jgi:hypothetical protein
LFPKSISVGSERYAVTQPPSSLSSLLTTLRRNGVRFVLVGGVAAVVEGAPVSTFDLDIVPARDPRNVARLLEALGELDARYRVRPELRRKPTAELLAGEGHHLLMTRAGPLDVLGVIGKRRDFESLIRNARRRKLGEFFVWVLDLETQIAVKEKLGFAKDRAMLPTLRETLSIRRARRR